MDGVDERMRDAYIELGSAIASLRNMPLRRYSGDEEDMRVAACNESITRAAGLLDQARVDLGARGDLLETPIGRLGLLRAIARPVIWERIGELHRVRGTLAEAMAARGIEAPDDLPEGSPLERLAGHAKGRWLLFGAFAVVALAGGTIAYLTVIAGM